MADDVQEQQHQVVMLDSAGQIVAMSSEGSVVSDDILRQAMDVSSADNLIENMDVVDYAEAAEDGTIKLEDGTILNINSVNTGSDTEIVAAYSSHDNNFTPSAHLVTDEVQSSTNDEFVHGLQNRQDIQNDNKNESSSATITDKLTDINASNSAIESEGLIDETKQLDDQTGEIVDRPKESEDNAPDPVVPLGSSENPIRIIQRGNQYTSLQHLDPDQMSQIMQVVQQKHVASSTTKEGKTILYNPQTQTRIVYKVMHPSMLHAAAAKNTFQNGASSTDGIRRQIQVPRDMLTLSPVKPRKRKKDDEDEKKLDVPELTRDQKEAKKKIRPKTRSGRVSRPPKHMVQDYKHIHPVDWDEDYDDSDGGYSDFRESDEEKEAGNKTGSYELDLMSRGAFSCQACEKCYVGPGGLERHYRINPDHKTSSTSVKLDENGKKPNGFDMSSTDESTRDSLTSSNLTPISSPPALNHTSSKGMFDNSPNSDSDFPTVPVRTGARRGRPPGRAGRTRGRSRGGRFAFINDSSKRKIRLKNLVNECTDEELMEVVLSRLSKTISVWEYMLIQSEPNRQEQRHLDRLITEYELVQKQLGKLCKQLLKPIEAKSDGPHKVPEGNKIIDMTNPRLADSLGLSSGTYLLPPKPAMEPTFVYKQLQANKNSFHQTQSISEISNRRVEIVDPNKLVEGKRADKSPKSVVKINLTASMGLSTTISPPTIVQTPSSANQTDQFPNHSVKEPSKISTTLPNKPNARVLTIPSGQTVSSGQSLPVVSKETTRPVMPALAKSKSVRTPPRAAEKHTAPRIIIQTKANQAQTIDDLKPGDSLLNISNRDSIHSMHSGLDRLTPGEHVDDGISAQHVDHPVSHDVKHSSDAVSEDTKNEDISEPLNVLYNQEGQQILQDSDGATYILTSDQAEQYDSLTKTGETVVLSSNTLADPAHINGSAVGVVQDVSNVEREMMVMNGQENQTEILLETPEAVDTGTVYQTEDGLLLIQNQDGTFQVHSHSDEPINMDTLQALFNMEPGQEDMEQ